MELRSARMLIRPWQHHDDIDADAWPPYSDPLEPIWNLPRHWDSNWKGGFEFSGMRRAWAVEDAQGRLAGRISLREVDERRSSARLGITFSAPFVSRGLGTEALATFLDYFYSDLNFTRMMLDVAAPNRRAVRCYERLGFSYVGNDWRCVGHAFDRQLLDSPNYAHLRRYFRQSTRCFEVQFLEMELRREDWLRQR